MYKPTKNGLRTNISPRLTLGGLRYYSLNHGWHSSLNTITTLLGYDKLKPYGFPIHGAIDGFSRRVLWLQVVKSNNDPNVPAHLYLECVRDNHGCPLLLWSDCGTENGLAASMQCYFRAQGDDVLAGEKSHRYGSSHANQRIENWWSFFRRCRSSWWINYFKDLVHDGILKLGNELHMECAWLCFSPVIQQELNELVEHWNSHYIRRSRHDTLPGAPEVLYYLPELSGGSDYKVNVPLEKMNEMEAEYELEECINDHQEYFHYVMETRGLQFPSSADEALLLFQNLLEAA